MSSTYKSADTVFNTEKPCLSCGQPTDQTIPGIRGKAYLCNNCQEQEDEESEENDVIFSGEDQETEEFEDEALKQLVETVENCQSCKVDDPRNTENPDQDLCPECCADWNWHRENHGEVDAS